ncbi:MAG: D-aminoacyl-tRNA deacylase, partial [Synergistaceae bacterium]|nr:D-aminoacyl-tRNA deacylase [Synergistaceae bacterium]
MRAVVQRVARARVSVEEKRVEENTGKEAGKKAEGKVVGEIGGGLCILLGVGVGD